jgi:hypothetical protein
MRSVSFVIGLAAIIPLAVACGTDGESCYGPVNTVEHVRHVKRIQPGAPDAPYGPKSALEWGQVNFLHTVGTRTTAIDQGRVKIQRLSDLFRPIPMAGWLVT